MWLTNTMDKIYVLILSFMQIGTISYALRDVTINIPKAIRRGENAYLYCNYVLEDDSLYSVKWYKGQKEFYRFTPKDTPSIQIFPTNPDIRVVRDQSNDTVVVLSTVDLSLSGKYTCEVSADAPSFHTIHKTDDLRVVDFPTQKPIITGVQQTYGINDRLRANCTSSGSFPAANLTWYINGMPAQPSHLKTYRPMKNKHRLTAKLQIQFVVNHNHFRHGLMKLRCDAHIHEIYHKWSERIVHLRYEDEPGLERNFDKLDNTLDDYPQFTKITANHATSDAQNSGQVMWTINRILFVLSTIVLYLRLVHSTV